MNDRPWLDHDWLDRDAGPVVRPYAMTGGRVHPSAGGFDVVAMVVANRVTTGSLVGLQPEHRSILLLAREPLAVAEIAAHLDLPLGVVRVLIGDLLQRELVSLYQPPSIGEGPDDLVLQAVINGLRAL